jgi:Fe-S-cluster formation regulator IscX/YfhJ
MRMKVKVCDLQQFDDDVNGNDNLFALLTMSVSRGHE